MTAKPRLLDLFCCQGGAGKGYTDAGFDVTGVDCVPQPRYPFRFVQADALAYAADHGAQFDAIHASPPCQGYTTMSQKHPETRAEWPRLIGPLRELLLHVGLPYVIENVPGARSEMREPITLHGGMFGLRVNRPRLFETNWFVMGFTAASVQNPVGVYGKLDGRRIWTRVDGTEQRAPRTLEDAQRAMDMPWADWNGCREAIPPAYTRYIGEQLLALIASGAAA
jgi:DNA (cytosine-5)-methyltransferase 1